VEDLSNPGSAAFCIDVAGERRSIFLVRRGAEVFGYVNNCPHNGSPLDWQAGQFLDSKRQFVLCATHGATFRIEDGLCLGGPCAGKSLVAVPLSQTEGMVWLDEI
jgi:nitrite reductase/ring-hydroxylating ferredoxin subunit